MWLWQLLFFHQESKPSIAGWSFEGGKSALVAQIKMDACATTTKWNCRSSKMLRKHHFTATQTMIQFVFWFVGYGSNIRHRNSSGYTLKMSIIPVAVNPICKERGHGLQLLFQENLAHCETAVQWNLQEASLKMPTTPTERKFQRLIRKPKQAHEIDLFPRSFPSPSNDTIEGLACQGLRRPIVILEGGGGGSFGSNVNQLLLEIGGIVSLQNGVL